MLPITVGSFKIGPGLPLALIAGPCQIENRDHSLMIAEKISNICEKFSAKFIFKSSYDKANRSSINSTRGVGLEEGLKILQEISENFDCPTITDVHEPYQCKIAAEVVDILQIPAYLCRQTDLLLAAGDTGKPINVKKGQFLSPTDMAKVAEKISSTGNDKIML